MTDILDPSKIAALSLGNEAVQSPQTIHRVNLVKAWNAIKPGDKVLELGCGQGDMTAVLAAVVGDTGKVIAVDPADAANYGSPMTLKQAQDHLLASSIGKRITFVESDTIKFMRETSEQFDVVVLAQCLWYFDSPSVVADTFKAIKSLLKGNPKLLLAEFGLQTKHVAAMPHIHAILTMAALQVARADGQSNVRSVLSPAAFRKNLEDSGWKLEREEFITPDEAYQDARWEISYVSGKKFGENIDKHVKDERYRGLVHGMRDAVLGNAALIENKKYRSMDVWTAVYE